jgi:hypothetical protein
MTSRSARRAPGRNRRSQLLGGLINEYQRGLTTPSEHLGQPGEPRFSHGTGWFGDGAAPLSADDAFQAVLAHQPLDGGTGRLHALTPQLAVDSAGSVGLAGRGGDPADVLNEQVNS